MTPPFYRARGAMPSEPDILDTPQAGAAAIRGGAVRVVGYVAATLLSVVSAAIILRYLGAHRFGQYTTIFSLMAIVMGITDAGTSNIGVREHAVADRAEDRRRMLANLQGLRLSLTAAGVAAAILYAVAAPYTSAQVLGTALAGSGLLVTVMAVTLAIPLQAELQLVKVSGLEFVRQFSQVLALVALVAAGAGVAILLGATIVSGIVLLLATLLMLRGRVPLAIAAEREVWSSLMRDTLAYGAATAVGTLYAYVTILVMSVVAGDVETGYFGAAHRVWFVIATVPGLLVQSAFPLLARAATNNRDRLDYAMQRLFEVQAILGAGLALVVSAGAPVAIAIVAGSEYDPAIDVLRLLGLGLLGTAYIALGGYALLSLRLHRTLLLANLFALLTTAALSAVLAERHGAMGAAVAVVCGEVVLGASYVLALRRAGVRPHLGLVPRIALAAALGAVPAFALGLPAVLAAGLAAIVYAVALLALRAVPSEVTDAFSGLRRRRAAARTPPPSAPS